MNTCNWYWFLFLFLFICLVHTLTLFTCVCVGVCTKTRRRAHSHASLLYKIVRWIEERSRKCKTNEEKEPNYTWKTILWWFSSFSCRLFFMRVYLCAYSLNATHISECCNDNVNSYIVFLLSLSFSVCCYICALTAHTYSKDHKFPQTASHFDSVAIFKPFSLLSFYLYLYVLCVFFA